MQMLLLQQLCFNLFPRGQMALPTLGLGAKAEVVEVGVEAKGEVVLVLGVLVDRVFVSWWGCGHPFQHIFCPF